MSGDSDRELVREVMAEVRKVIRANQQEEIRKLAVEIEFPSITMLDNGWTLQSWPMSGRWVVTPPKGRIMNVDHPNGPGFYDREKFHQLGLRMISCWDNIDKEEK